MQAHYEKETQFLNDPSTPLHQSACAGDDFLVNLPIPRNDRYGSDQIVQIDDVQCNDYERPQASSLRFGRRQNGELEEDLEDVEDHVPVLFPKEKKAYILMKNPETHVAANGNSKNDKPQGTNSMASEDSKGSYVSNGSASNGYVMGILKQRRHNNTEC